MVTIGLIHLPDRFLQVGHLATRNSTVRKESHGHVTFGAGETCPVQPHLLRCQGVNPEKEKSTKAMAFRKDQKACCKKAPRSRTLAPSVRAADFCFQGPTPEPIAMLGGGVLIGRRRRSISLRAAFFPLSAPETCHEHQRLCCAAPFGLSALNRGMLRRPGSAGLTLHEKGTETIQNPRPQVMPLDQVHEPLHPKHSPPEAISTRLKVEPLQASPSDSGLCFASQSSQSPTAVQGGLASTRQNPPLGH